MWMAALIVVTLAVALVQLCEMLTEYLGEVLEKE